MPFAKKRLPALLAVAVAAASVLSCSGDQSSTQLPPLPPGSTQPVDIYLADSVTLIDEAELDLRDRCLSDRGFPMRQEVNSDASRGEHTPFPKPVQPRTKEQAQKYGFGSPIPAQSGKIIHSDPAFDAAFEECEEHAFEQMSVEAENFRETLSQYNNLFNSIRQEISEKADGIIADNGERLIGCLSDRGYSLPDGGEFNAEAGIEQFGIEPGSTERGQEPELVEERPGVKVFAGTPAREYIPTPAEQKFAVAFVECGQQTGLFAEIDTEWEAIQQDVVEEHAAEFAELNPRIAELAHKAAQAVGG